MAKPQNNFMKYASMGTQIAVTILIGVFAGIKLDAWLGLKFPVFTVVLSLVAVVAGMYLAVKDLLKKK
jgi:F0F1-type ATP synthase assembly protein I